MAVLLCTVAWLAAAQTAQEPKRVATLTGKIVEIPEFESKALGNKRPVHVYLPPNYETEKRSYPVLYVHDGQNVFNGASSYLPNREWRLDETAEALIRAGLIEPIIIVGIDNAGMERGNEYLPTRFKMNRGDVEVGGKADLYGKMLIEEIKPMIDRTYRTKKGARDTGLMGSSFGGIITMYLGLTHPDVFGRLGILSPSIWVDDRLMLKKVEALPRKLPLKVWLDMGTSEGLQPLGDARATAKAMEKKGWKPGSDFVYYEEGFAEHNEDAWARRSPAILMFLFGKR
jgi:predicted alpha/beta superfamily hydrolase